MRGKLDRLIHDLKRENFTRTPKLKRRLRKKLRLGDFQELGFEIKTQFKSDLTEVDFDRFLMILSKMQSKETDCFLAAVEA